MPIYDFKCTACGHQDEKMRKINDDSTMECPTCKQATFSKMLSAPSFHLSGTGWYATDFKDKPKVQAKAESEKKVDAPIVPTAHSASPVINS
jgi:putative FmdB family regulatory protein